MTPHSQIAPLDASLCACIDRECVAEVRVRPLAATALHARECAEDPAGYARLDDQELLASPTRRRLLRPRPRR